MVCFLQSQNFLLNVKKISDKVFDNGGQSNQQIAVTELIPTSLGITIIES